MLGEARLFNGVWEELGDARACDMRLDRVLGRVGKGMAFEAAVSHWSAAWKMSWPGTCTFSVLPSWANSQACSPPCVDMRRLAPLCAVSSCAVRAWAGA